MVAKASLVELARGGAYDTDKSDDYLSAYDDVFAVFREREIRLLELGVYHGGSLRLWRDYFPRGTIVGIDLNPPDLDGDARMRVFRGSQDDADLLHSICASMAPDGFDVIIDDCSHFARETSRSFRILFEDHLKPGGAYSIEDWGTGYWPWWPDGAAYRPAATETRDRSFERIQANVARALRRGRRSEYRNHQAGMVGFVKQLVDVVGSPDIHRATAEVAAGPPSHIDRLIIRSGLAIVVKAAPPFGAPG